jgi:hypothetical protein
MLTETQRESSRRNGSQSRGPATPAGKSISSRNSFKTGLYAHSLIIQGEKREDFETLQNEYYTHYQPQSPAERDLLDTMVRLVWQLRRYAHVEAELWDWEVYDQSSRGSISRHYPLGDMFSQCGDKFSRLQRMQNAAQGKFKDALHELERLQAARPAQPVEEETTSVLEENVVGFVPSTEVEQAVSPADAGEGTPVEPAESSENAPAAPVPGFVSSTYPEPAFSSPQFLLPNPPRLGSIPQPSGLILPTETTAKPSASKPRIPLSKLSIFCPRGQEYDSSIRL